MLTIIALLSSLLVWQTFKHTQIKRDISKIQEANHDSLISQGAVDKAKVNSTDSIVIAELSASNDADLQPKQIWGDSVKKIENSSDALNVLEMTQPDDSVYDKPPIYDDEWEYSTETTISDLFYTHEYLSDLILESIECKSSVCELKINKNSEDTTKTSSLTDLHQISLVQMALNDKGIEIAHNKPLELQRVGGSLVFKLHDPKL